MKVKLEIYLKYPVPNSYISGGYVTNDTPEHTFICDRIELQDSRQRIGFKLVHINGNPDYISLNHTNYDYKITAMED